jgi:AmmeMemoRadiSam system protein A
METTEEQRGALLTLARRSIASRIQAISSRVYKVLPASCDEAAPGDPVYTELRAVFITLRLGGRLRGCIGNIEACETLWQNVWYMAQQAAFHDPRFPPLGEAEFDKIDIEISILSSFRESTVEEIVVGKHGVFLEKAGRSSVFLPQIATEQGWNKETLLTELCYKAGLPAAAWKSGARFSTFTSEKFGESGR